MSREIEISVTLRVRDTEADADSWEAAKDARDTIVRVAELAGGNFYDSIVCSNIQIV